MSSTRDFNDLITKLKKEKNMVATLIVCAVLLLGCVFIGVYHVRRIHSTFEHTSYEYIFDRAQVTSNNFSNDFIRKGTLVESEALSLAKIDDISKPSICQGLVTLENSAEFDYARYISKRGIKYKPDGSINSVVMSDYVHHIDDNAAYSVYSLYKSDEKTNSICFASPVKKNGIVQGYVMGVIEAAELFSGFDNDSTKSVAERYLVDDEGNIVIYTKGDKAFDGEQKNIYTILTANCIDDYDAENTKEDIKNLLVANDMNNMEITLDGKKGYALFKELSGDNGWAIFYIVYEENVKSLINPVILESVVSLVLIVLIIGIMATIIMRYLSSEQKKVHELAYVDKLTNAPNENAFREKAAKLLADNDDVAYIISCFDIMNFRYINECYGHEKADTLLRALVEALSESFGHNETYARVGADRFVSLSVDDGRMEERKVFISDKLKETTEAINMKYPVKIKSGVYIVRDHKEPISDMIDKANLARKSVNSDDRVTEAEYKDELMESTRKQESIESRMEAALYNGEFVPYLQPKWDMEKNHICGAEALVRWRTPDGKIVPPGDFIPLFEANGFIERVDFYMLEEICKYIRRMLDEGREVYPVSINQSRYLMHDPNYISRVQEIFLKYKVPRGFVELELTETVFFHDKDVMIKIMNQLKNLNMHISIDDFGSGYSSLNLLRDIPFDVLKIDRGFLDESSQTESGKWILKKIVEMAEGMNLCVICEGVETQDQVDMLLGIGCKYAQGYLYSRPIPLEEYIEKYGVIRSEETKEEKELVRSTISEFIHEDIIVCTLMQRGIDVETSGEMLSGHSIYDVEVMQEAVGLNEGSDSIVEELLAVDDEIEEISEEDSTTEEVAVEEMPIKETPVEEPDIEEVATEESAIEETPVEEPAMEEVVTEEPIIVEASIEEPAVEQTTIEEKAIEETVDTLVEEVNIQQESKGHDALEDAVAMPFWLV